ncbi:MAG: pyridoxamine 5'-phosphate oxidase family protein [Candidatus Cloacimonetes bacterium]|nr:pyridoxamine 5'-phosphate oxidase family protein [Candidatus Cloacimonadota bacterium]
MEKHDEAIRNEVWQFFKPLQIVYFATVDKNEPKVRPVTMLYLEKRFWILTGTIDQKVIQIKGNPNIELCIPLYQDNHNGCIRLAGKGYIVESKETRARIAGQCEYFHNYWQDTNDPNYTLIELEFSEVDYLRPGEMETHRFNI